MSNADELLKELRTLNEPFEKRFLDHHYVEAIESGQLKESALSAFAAEQYHIITSDLRSIAFLYSRETSSTGQQFFWDVLQGEKEALKNLIYFSAALHLSDWDMEMHEPAAGAQAYKAFMAWLAVFGSSAEVAAALIVNLPAWAANCARMSRGLKIHYGLKDADVAFFDLFSSPSSDFQRMAVAVMDEGLRRGVEIRAVRRSARLVQEYELMFWDTLYEHSRA
ncbi:MAG: transcriptional regulator [Deltaproteobacteria bacterium]|nr:transcriptional regulator [Deltaproteobacteria bacterium]